MILDFHDGKVSKVELDWDLKSPCHDCPFRRDAPDHAMIASSIPEYVERLQEGTMPPHTCHQTDNRPSCDGPRNWKGERPKHCAGLLRFIVRAKLPIQKELAHAIGQGKIDLDTLIKSAKRDKRIFASVRELVNYYAGVAEHLLAKEKLDPVIFCWPPSINDMPLELPLSEAHRLGYTPLECKKCGKPSSSYDHHWPYEVSHNFCPEHGGDSIRETARELADLRGATC